MATLKQIRAHARARKAGQAARNARRDAGQRAFTSAAKKGTLKVSFGTTTSKSKSGAARKMFTVTGVWPGYGAAKAITRKAASKSGVEALSSTWKARFAARQKRSAQGAAYASNPRKKGKVSIWKSFAKAKSNPGRNSKGRFVKANPGRKSSRRR